MRAWLPFKWEQKCFGGVSDNTKQRGHASHARLWGHFTLPEKAQILDAGLI